MADSNGITRNIPLHQMVVDVLIKGGVTGAVTVGTSAVEAKVGATSLRNRKSLTVYNASAATVYWSFQEDVTTATGIAIPASSCTSFAVAEDCLIYLIAGTGGLDVRVAEGA